MTREEYNNIARHNLITFISAIVGLILFISILTISWFQSGELYTMRGIVTEVNTMDRLTTFTDENGESWRFKGVKGWTVGDMITVTVNSNNTEDFHDDKVIGANKIDNFKKGIN